MNLKFPENPSYESLKDFLEKYPSTSWFALSALEGLSNFAELANAGRIPEKKYAHYEDPHLTCWRCNGHIAHHSNQGMAQPYKAGAKFNDHWQCRGKHNVTPVICGACDALADRAYHPNFKLNALYTEDNAYQLTLDEDLISFLIDPPPAPWLFVMAENNSQHMVWLSDYSFNTDVISIQKSRDRFLVSRTAAFELACQYRDILNLANSLRQSLGRKEQLSTPLESGRREINNRTDNNLVLSKSILSLCQSKDDYSLEQAELSQQLLELTKKVEETGFNYGTWYVATMYLKALLNDFKLKPISEWQQMKAPK